MNPSTNAPVAAPAIDFSSDQRTSALVSSFPAELFAPWTRL
ncbi:MAG: hypothetical protein R3C15_02115 [Thermoleophilia bacterium]